VVERTIGRTELYVTDEMFLCGTGAEITPVRSVDRRSVGNGGVGPITARLQQHFGDVVRGRVPHRREWLTPVWP
jgi:branched-chain amino acid aminotransferase